MTNRKTDEGLEPEEEREQMAVCSVCGRVEEWDEKTWRWLNLAHNPIAVCSDDCQAKHYGGLK